MDENIGYRYIPVLARAKQIIWSVSVYLNPSKIWLNYQSIPANNLNLSVIKVKLINKIIGTTVLKPYFPIFSPTSTSLFFFPKHSWGFSSSSPNRRFHLQRTKTVVLGRFHPSKSWITQPREVFWGFFFHFFSKIWWWSHSFLLWIFPFS